MAAVNNGENDGQITRRNFVKAGLASLLLGVASLGASGAEAGPANDFLQACVNELATLFEKTKPENMGKTFAEYLQKQSGVFVSAIDAIRAKGTKIPMSAESNATFYVTPKDPNKPDIASLGFRASTDQDWMTVYVGTSSHGPWIQIYQIQTRDQGYNLNLLLEYGKRDDGF
jgi:hypothetical protein